MTQPPLPPALEFLQQLWQVNHTLERLSSRMEKSIGVTGQQRLIIRCVGRQPGLFAGHLAQLLHLDRGTVSATVKRLEAKKLISRRSDPSDGRRVSLRLTAKGQALDRPRKGTAEHAVDAMMRTQPAAQIEATRAVLLELAQRLIAEMA